MPYILYHNYLFPGLSVPSWAQIVRDTRHHHPCHRQARNLGTSFHFFCRLSVYWFTSAFLTCRTQCPTIPSIIYDPLPLYLFFFLPSTCYVSIYVEIPEELTSCSHIFDPSIASRHLLLNTASTRHLGEAGSSSCLALLIPPGLLISLLGPFLSYIHWYLHWPYLAEFHLPSLCTLHPEPQSSNALKCFTSDPFLLTALHGTLCCKRKGHLNEALSPLLLLNSFTAALHILL